MIINMKSSKSKGSFVLDCASTQSKMSEYNGLRDSNLAGFFASRKRRKLLQKNGLITKSGLIVSKATTTQFPDNKQSKPYLLNNGEFSPEESIKRKHQRSASPKASTTGKKVFEKKEVKPLSSEELKSMFQKYRKTEPGKTDNQALKN